MGYADRYLKCVECTAEFIFTVGEQEYFANHGLTNEPKRCPECRARRKQRRREGEHKTGHERRAR
jgi:Probable zinc-ribbon domain